MHTQEGINSAYQLKISKFIENNMSILLSKWGIFEQYSKA